MATAERFLRERYGAEVMDHRVFGICSDGDLMEGVSAEAAPIAGHLGLGHLPPGQPKVSVEAAVSFGWERWVDRSVSIERFGASAPGETVMRELGMTPEAVAAAVRALL